MDPEAVLGLMRSAPERYETVRATLRYRGEGSTVKMLREQFSGSRAYERTFGGPPESAGRASHPEPDGAFGWRCRIWRVDDFRWRRELDGGVDIMARTGSRRPLAPRQSLARLPKRWHRRVGGPAPSEDPLWIRLAKSDFWTMYPFDPANVAPLVDELEEINLRVEDRTWFAGRAAYRLVCTLVGELHHPPEPLFWGADEYEALVDAERGIVLRCASRLGDEDFDALEVEEVFFDEPFGSEVFRSREPLF